MLGHSYFNQKILTLCIVILNHYKLILMELMFISKHITSKYHFLVIEFKIILMILILLSNGLFTVNIKNLYMTFMGLQVFQISCV